MIFSEVNPLKVILFGSFANGTYMDESDYDFYLVIDDGREAYNFCNVRHSC